MLAMQLAAEDDAFLAVDPDPDPDPDAHLNQLISNFEKRSHQQVQRHTPMEQEDVSIPASPPPSYNEFAAAGEAFCARFISRHVDIIFIILQTHGCIVSSMFEQIPLA